MNDLQNKDLIFLKISITEVVMVTYRKSPAVTSPLFVRAAHDLLDAQVQMRRIWSKIWRKNILTSL